MVYQGWIFCLILSLIVMKHISTPKLPIYITMALLAIAVALFPLIQSKQLQSQLEQEERSKIEMWAHATQVLANDSEETDVLALLLKIIQSNKTIPVILTTSQDSIISFNNISLPTRCDTTLLLQEYLKEMRQEYPPIIIRLDADYRQYLYYAESSTLKRLHRFPSWQAALFVLFLLSLLFAYLWAKRSAQDRLWVGLSKETAHQLGTPISSLMAWVDLLKEHDLPTETIQEMTKDLNRLEVIAHRFQKIGSEPQRETCDLVKELSQSVHYIRPRISRGVSIVMNLPDNPLPVQLIPHLFSWVIECLLKNAVDAMQGRGTITLSLTTNGSWAIIDITDTGRGIPHKYRSRIFSAGFTTKARGWGLGLSLAKRIINKFHRGSIVLLKSEVGRGTTFRIKLKCNEK